MILFRNPLAWHRGLPGPSGPEPQKSPKRVRKGVPGPEPQSPQRVCPGVCKDSKKSPKLRFWTLFGLRGALFGNLGLPGARGPGTPFRTLFGLFWGCGPEGPGSPLCQAGGFLIFGREKRRNISLPHFCRVAALMKVPIFGGFPVESPTKKANRLKARLSQARKKPININIFGGTVSGTNRNRPWDKWDPSPGQNGTRPWDKPAFLCLIPQ